MLELDCHDCGQSIEIPKDKHGCYRPDSEVSCTGCGAVHILNVEDSVYLVLDKRGGEVIAGLRAEVERLREVQARVAELTDLLKSDGDIKAAGAAAERAAVVAWICETFPGCDFIGHRIELGDHLKGRGEGT